MAANQPAGSVSTYSASASIREDLADVIYLITPLDTYCLSKFGREDAQSTLHEWQEDSLKDFTSGNAAPEGGDFSALTAAAPTRVKNYCQNSRKEIVVTGTQEAVRKAGMRSMMAYQLMKAGKELKRDIEASILSKNTATAGAINGNRLSAGIVTYCETSLLIKNAGQANVTNTAWAAGGIPNSDMTIAASATAMTSADLKTALGVAWTNGGETDTILTTATIRDTMSLFTGIATRFSDVARGREAVITDSADVFVSQYGSHKIVTSRYALAGTVYCLDTSMWAVAYLRPFQTLDIAKSGDSTKKMLIAEWCLVGKNHTSTTCLVNRT
jgi:hypothetical protein